MCAIFGWIKKTGVFNDKELALCRRALLTMKHRGPNHTGEAVFNDVFMGHNRLKIIDLSDGANQPFLSDDGRFILSFNGEIYNYIELRRDLEKEGVVFRTSSDTEVLLKKFIKEKESSFSALDGMFAGAVYDKASKKHYLFRDHLGQKPLYYFEYPEGLIYGSELRAFLSLDYFRWKLDLNNFLKFLTHSCYIWDTTPLEGVKKLLPGCYLELDNKLGKSELHRYWDSVPGTGESDMGFDEAILEFKRLFDRSCQINMRSDAPYGVFLSGGVDSSMVLDSCHRLNQGISAFHVSMSESDFDESHKADIIAGSLGIKNKKRFIMDENSIKDSLDSFFSLSDEPHGDPGWANTYFLAKSCRKDITVALAGDGADELFAGYISFLALGPEKWFKHCPGALIPFIKQISKRVIPGNDMYLGMQFKAVSFLQGFPAKNGLRFPLWLGAIAPEDLYRLCPWKEFSFFSREAGKDSIFADIYAALSVADARSRIKMLLYYYQKFFLPEFVCAHTDRAAMLNSLEVRSPFLSVEIIEFANRLPDRLKTDGRKLKNILRQVLLRQGLPRQIYQQKKHGFTFPVARWLKSALRSRMNESLSLKRWDNGLIDHAFMNFLKHEHLTGKSNNYRILFNLMVFSEWLERHPQVEVKI